MKTLKTLYDVQQLLKKYGILVHVGKRKWDIELMAIELDNLYKAGILEKKVYLNAKLVLRHEHEYEEKLEKENRLD
ncbi:Putative uncharacterized protein [Lactobacillus equicursoris DSM 19284 = JCM 14600 = CIP 110162]|uniref:Cytosolic protein n=1 Tax=Lactobacillus equicursoris DSM 19284 = JCM 14600 = CIP 110162 TaxID=1293597 RepID=K0NT83_9LACO|nr:YqgQ family protein [Lactobacillus equicursoris]KRL02217.1 hypothetical protein FC20_GL000406 [Lactobacillus equicursoris DSM 19284 = JCM 14600 = CIP 110162]CCK85504.1 Putative uncharacterized protein [Lactobacillus equicursoris DSM 19284 = JCM 14600 = CIP 110162]